MNEHGVKRMNFGEVVEKTADKFYEFLLAWLNEINYIRFIAYALSWLNFLV